MQTCRFWGRPSNIIQNQTILSPRAQELDRGPPAYMSPEILLPELRPNEATLKAADSWAYGMILFVLVNPSVGYPYQGELRQEMSTHPLKEPVDNLREIFRRRQSPQHCKLFKCNMLQYG